MKQTASIVVDDPCLRCGKLIRADYLGLCMPARPPEWSGAGGDCADTLGVSELDNRGEPTDQELKIIAQYRSKKNVRTGRNHPGE